MKVIAIVHSSNPAIKKILKILSIFYGTAVFIRNYLYDKAILKSSNMPKFSIGIGNIIAGGAGKTPFVIWLAKKFKSDGITAGVITNGYGGKGKGEYLVSDGEKNFVHTPYAQDEASLIAAYNIPVASGRNRLRAAKLFQNVDCIIIDDSFQYRKAKKDIEILILSKKPFDNGLLLPAGLLREDISGIKRADIILSQSPLIQNKIPVFKYNLKPSCLASSSGQMVFIKKLKNPITAFCAIANPENFFDDLSSLGINIDRKMTFPDHHNYSKKEVSALAALSGSLITTEKDMTKLSDMKNLYILKQKIEIEPDIYKIIKEKFMRNLNNE